MFEISSLTSATQGQTLILILFSLMLAFALSLLLVFTFDKTTKDTFRPDHFIQALILMTIVTTMIMQSIGDSLARSFGIFGALAILRFRINISSPRNVSFVFAAMAVGIACGVNSYLSAVIGTLVFCLIAFLLCLTPFSGRKHIVGVLRFDLPKEGNEMKGIQELIQRFTKGSALKRYRIFDNNVKSNLIEYEYKIKLKNELQGVQLAEALKELKEVKDVRISFDDPNENQNN